MDNLHVALLQGGQSAEREISLQSGQAVANALIELGHQISVVDGYQGLKSINKAKVDIVFNMLHGDDGEDGQLAAWLNLEGFVSTCCDFAATCASWHKGKTKLIAEDAGLLTPSSQLLKDKSELNLSNSGPWIVKPATEGSSVGLFKANTESELIDAVEQAFKVADEILVESFIKGTECTVGIVGDVVLPVVSIQPASELYDYQAKYNSKNTQYHCPANFDDSWQVELQQDALKIYHALNVNGWCRVDFIIDDQGQRWFLEVNTTPGMTTSSLLPKAAAVHGWNFNQLVAHILDTATSKMGTTNE